MVVCPSCKEKIDTQDNKVCPSCGWQFNIVDKGVSIVKPAARPKIQVEIDLGITVDRTASSELFQTGIQETLGIMLTQVEAKAKKVVVYLASHGDIDEGQNPILHTDGGSPDQAINDMKKIIFDEQQKNILPLLNLGEEVKK